MRNYFEKIKNKSKKGLRKKSVCIIYNHKAGFSGVYTYGRRNLAKQLRKLAIANLKFDENLKNSIADEVRLSTPEIPPKPAACQHQRRYI